MGKKNDGKLCPKNIFIISSISYVRSLKYALHFCEQQKCLESIGFTVVNPIETQNSKNGTSYTHNTGDNLKKIIDCKWVCIMPDVSLKNSSNTELLICLEMDMIIIHGNVLEIEIEITQEEEIICLEIEDESNCHNYIVI